MPVEVQPRPDLDAVALCNASGRLACAIVALLGLGNGVPGLAGQEPDCNGRSVLRVVVLDEAGAIPIPTATVILRWTETDQGRRPVRQEVGPDGGLVLCAPPDARQATLWAEFGDASSEEAVVGITPRTLHGVELRLRSGAVTTGRLLGEVRDALTDRPIVAAAVSVVGGTAMAETNRRGSFILSGVPVGVHELTVRRLGYAPLAHAVAVLRGVTTEIEIAMAPDPVEMAPIVAVATRSRRLEVKGFYERKYWGELIGGATFLTEADIERRRPIFISHLIADEPGIRLQNCRLRRGSCQLVNIRGSSRMSGGCPVTFYLDGTPVRGLGGRMGESIDDLVRPFEIAGVEIYVSASSLAAEFGGSASQCGVVAIWTK